MKVTCTSAVFVVAIVEAFPTGAPADTCDTLTPSSSAPPFGHGASPQNPAI